MLVEIRASLESSSIALLVPDIVCGLKHLFKKFLQSLDLDGIYKNYSIIYFQKSVRNGVERIEERWLLGEQKAIGLLCATWFALSLSLKIVLTISYFWFLDQGKTEPAA